MVMVDDSHAVGFIGATGRGTPERAGVSDRVDIVTGTLGKALGGASGGYTSGRAEIIALLPPALTPLPVLQLARAVDRRRVTCRARPARLRRRAARTAARQHRAVPRRDERRRLRDPPGEHPIVPVMYGDAPAAVTAAQRMLEHGVYVVPFSYPVVPHGQARIRTQVSAAHTTDDVDRAVMAFTASR